MKVISTEVSPGKTILIQVDESVEIISAAKTGGQSASLIEPSVMLAKFDDVAETITDMCKAVFEKVAKELKESSPSELAVEFGVTLGGEAGIPLVTKGTVEAAFKVTATWDFDKNKLAATKS